MLAVLCGYGRQTPPSSYLWKRLFGGFLPSSSSESKHPFQATVFFGFISESKLRLKAKTPQTPTQLKKNQKGHVASITLQRDRWPLSQEGWFYSDAGSNLAAFSGSSWLQEGLGFTNFRVQPSLHAYAERLVIKALPRFLQKLRTDSSWALSPLVRVFIPSLDFDTPVEGATSPLDLMFFYPRSRLEAKKATPSVATKEAEPSYPSTTFPTFRSLGGLWSNRLANSNPNFLLSLTSLTSYPLKFGRVERLGEASFFSTLRALRPLPSRRFFRSQGVVRFQKTRRYHGLASFKGFSAGSLNAWTHASAFRPLVKARKPASPHPYHLINQSLKTEASLLVEQLRTTRLDFDFRTLTSRFRQPSVRYRPGFFTYWRLYRHELQQRIQPWGGFRQHALTRFVAKTRRISSFSGFRLFQLSVWRLLSYSKLIKFDGVVNHLIAVTKGGGLFLNGRAVLNPHAQVYVGDTLATSVNSKPRTNPPLGSNFATRSTFLNTGAGAWAEVLMEADTPACLEVDELSMSIVLLFEPQRWLGQISKLAGSHEVRALPGFSTYKLYNWKYTT